MSTTEREKAFNSLMAKIKAEKPVIKAIASVLLNSEDWCEKEIICSIGEITKEHNINIDVHGLVDFWLNTGNLEYWQITKVSKNFSLYSSEMYCYETIKKYIKK